MTTEEKINEVETVEVPVTEITTTDVDIVPYTSGDDKAMLKGAAIGAIVTGLATFVVAPLVRRGANKLKQVVANAKEKRNTVKNEDLDTEEGTTD